MGLHLKLVGDQIIYSDKFFLIIIIIEYKISYKIKWCNMCNIGRYGLQVNVLLKRLYKSKDFHVKPTNAY